jgi:hypothetical protein
LCLNRTARAWSQTELCWLGWASVIWRWQSHSRYVPLN